jgi:hypothetical protein
VSLADGGLLEEEDGDRFNRYLIDADYREAIFRLADAIIEGQSTTEAAASFGVVDPALVTLAAQMAGGRRRLLTVTKPFMVGVVFSMWREARRLGPHSESNPTGEDSLIHKLSSLEWACAGTTISYTLYGVDDDCPEDSYGHAIAAARRSPLGEHVKLYRLADGFPYSRAPLCHLKRLEDSQKGGGIALGTMMAFNDGVDFVCHTDCDNSVHLGQLGNLLSPLILDGAKVVLGDKSKDGSVIFWHPQRNTETPSAMTLVHLRRMLPQFTLLTKDMTHPFKGYSADYLKNILERMRSFDFAFDIDLSLALVKDGVVPSMCSYTFLDSFVESAWHHHGNHRVEFQRLTGLLRAIRTHDLPHDEELAGIIDTLITTPADVATILASPPPQQLRETPYSDLGTSDLMSAREMGEWFRTIGL